MDFVLKQVIFIHLWHCCCWMSRPLRNQLYLLFRQMLPFKWVRNSRPCLLVTRVGCVNMWSATFVRLIIIGRAGQVAGCDFTARNASTLQKHVRKVHEGNTDPLYECHICQLRLHNSTSLRSHLGNVHHVTPLAGNARFKYPFTFCLYLFIIIST